MPRKEEYNYQGYPTHPRNVDKRTWFYEEKKGLCVVRQIRDSGGELLQGDIFHIPWKFITAAARTPAAARRRITKRNGR